MLTRVITLTKLGDFKKSILCRLQTLTSFLTFLERQRFQTTHKRVVFDKRTKRVVVGLNMCCYTFIYKYVRDQARYWSQEEIFIF